MKKTKYIEPGQRLMDRAYMRDGNVVHSGEALVLALLLRARGSKREKQSVEVAKMLDDPNLPKKPRRKK